MSERLQFIGVSTAGSSINELFPRWAEILGIDATIAGRDLPVRADPRAYRAAVVEIAEDEAVRGALVTAHKVDVYEHAHDLFDVLDANARLCGEISCISKRDGKLVGHAKDTITAGLSMDAMLRRGYWSETGAHVLCLGAGGAGTAITVRLLQDEDRPERIVVTDRDPDRLAALRDVHSQLRATERVAYHAAEGTETSDSLLADLPPSSLVVNATGMGKDLPGSPISDAGRFPVRAVVWELNYRGELTFLRQARSQQSQRELRVHDGWRYFLHGWTEVIAEVFAIALTPELFARLAGAAEPFRPDGAGLTAADATS
jgi:shikimate dehydrogenase